MTLARVRFLLGISIALNLCIGMAVLAHGAVTLSTAVELDWSVATRAIAGMRAHPSQKACDLLIEAAGNDIRQLTSMKALLTGQGRILVLCGVAFLSASFLAAFTLRGLAGPRDGEERKD